VWILYDNLGEAGLFVIRTIFSIRRIFGLCFWKWDLYAAELGCGFCMTNVRMYIKKGYGGLMCAYAHKVVGVQFFVYVCIFLALFDSLQRHAIASRFSGLHVAWRVLNVFLCDSTARTPPV
jgi:hypothetical protein